MLLLAYSEVWIIVLFELVAPATLLAFFAFWRLL